MWHPVARFRGTRTRRCSFMLNLPPGWRDAYRDFALASPRPVGVRDCDGDGLTSGVLWQRALERAGLQPTSGLREHVYACVD